MKFFRLFISFISVLTWMAYGPLPPAGGSAHIAFSVPHAYAATPAAEDPVKNLQDRLKESANKASIGETGLSKAGEDPKTGIPKLIGDVVGYIIGLVGIIFFAMMLYGGFIWMTGGQMLGGLDKKTAVSKAQEIIKHGVTGLVILLLSYGLVKIIITLFTASPR